MNPMAMMKIKPLLEKFRDNHPKVPMFFAAAAGKIQEGSVIELSVQAPDGNPICTNIRVTADDIELINFLKDMASKQ